LLAEWARFLEVKLKSIPSSLHVSFCAISCQRWGLLQAQTAYPSSLLPLEDGEAADQQPIFFDRQADTIGHVLYHSYAVPISSISSLISGSVYLDSAQDLHSFRTLTHSPAFHVHLLHIAHSPSSLLSISLHRHFREVTHNLVDLYHFGEARFPALATSKLPWHVALLLSLQNDRVARSELQFI
jgi:hypothetical protein